MVKLKGRIIKILRGRYNSVRYRFFILPREWVTYIFCYRLIGRSWIEFYASRMDGFAVQGRSALPSDSYINAAKEHFNFLKTQDLMPHHRVLDYGCGFMRTGLFIAPYLSDGYYVGVDISQQRLKTAAKLAAAKNLSDDSYELILVSNCYLTELIGYKFDYIWSGSVIHHMPESDIRTFLKSLKFFIDINSQFFFTFTPASDGQYERLRIKDFYYSISKMKQICESEGYIFQMPKEWNYKDGGDRAVKLMLLSDKETSN